MWEKPSRSHYTIEFFLIILSRLIITLLSILLVIQLFMLTDFGREYFNYSNKLYAGKRFDIKSSDVDYVKIRLSKDIDNYSIQVNGREANFTANGINTIMLEVRDNDIINIINSWEKTNSSAEIISVGDKIRSIKAGKTYKLDKYINSIGMVNFK
ncbi:MAG: hypothetical protein PHP06_01565 [Clostridia bacterium]|nr:hypothetical protein [Clostridia bacterium]